MFYMYLYHETNGEEEETKGDGIDVGELNAEDIDVELAIKRRSSENARL